MSIYAVNFLWILSTGLGVALAVYGAREAYLDLKALNELKQNGDKKVLANGSLVGQLVLLLGQLSFLAPGVMSLFAPVPENPVSVTAGLLILGSWCMTIATFVAIYVNRKVQLSPAEQQAVDDKRNAVRDEGRDEGRDPIRDEARDLAHDKEIADAE